MPGDNLGLVGDEVDVAGGAMGDGEPARDRQATDDRRPDAGVVNDEAGGQCSDGK